MFNIFGFYKFKKISNIKKIKNLLQVGLLNNKVRGTIIISVEGINGTISTKTNNLSNVKKILKRIFLFKKFDSENSTKSKINPFHRVKVKIKKK